MRGDIICKTEKRSDVMKKETNGKQTNQACRSTCKLNNDLISAMHSFRRSCTSFAFSNSGLIFSGVIANFGSGSPLERRWGGIDLTEPFFGAFGSREDGLAPTFECLAFDDEWACR
jgi:hypothetical protein